MSQQSGSFSLVIHDKNGNPQYLKVQKTQPKSIKTEGVKLMPQKSSTTTVPQVISSSGGTLVPGSQILRTVTLQGKPSRQYVTIPVQPSVQSIIKQEHPTVQTSGSKPVSGAQKLVLSSQKSSKPSSYMLPIIETNGSRKRIDEAEFNELLNQYQQTVKRRKTEKGGKGLRHFSMKVCEKVKKKGLTSYNEVADELVSEFTDPKHIPNSVDQQYDQKNIRRRVYDALNVLMAMNIISKEKKEIRWLGLPTTSAQECVSLMNEKKLITERIHTKTQRLNDLIVQQVLYKSIIRRNYEQEQLRGPPVPNSAIQLPFIVLNSDKKTVIDCSITNDKTEYLFVFNDKFEMNDDFEVLKQLGLTYGLENGSISKSNIEKVKTLVPKSLEKYVDKMISDAAMKEAKGNLAEGESCEKVVSEEYMDESAGPSADGYSVLEEQDSTMDGTTDDESNISTDMEIN